MANKILIGLINSLSTQEINTFFSINNYSNKRQVYMTLLDIILSCKNQDWASIRSTFSQKCGSASIENASSYLYKQILDMLVREKLVEDQHFKAIYHISKTKVLAERNLQTAAYEEANILYESYTNSDNLVLRYSTIRNYLNFETTNDFLGLSEKELVAIQEKGREVLKELKNNHEHFALYELLKHRIINKKNTKNELTFNNDLILNELAIMGHSAKRSLEAQKLHYLFQSFYFTSINNYSAAIKTFVQLNELFENRITINNQNIFDYYSMLDGILSSLRMEKRTIEMGYFVDKLFVLLEHKIPEYFKIMIKKTIAINHMSLQLLSFDPSQGLNYLTHLEKDTVNKYPFIDLIKQSELLFYIALTYYRNDNTKKALKTFAKTEINLYRENTHPIFKTIKLFTLLLHYEAKDLLFLNYEIRNFVRHAKGQDNLTEIEKLLFRIFKTNDFQLKNNKELKHFLAIVKANQPNHRREIMSKQHFDFVVWAEHKLLG